MAMGTSRPTLDQYFIRMARLVGTRTTCRHREQGAVLVKDNRIISAGYNGAPPGQPHCIDLDYCAKDKGLTCRAEGLHGESNAILTAAKLGISTKDSILYCVYSPCRSCCNMLKVAGIVGVMHEKVYDGFREGPEYLKELGIWCQKINLT